MENELQVRQGSKGAAAVAPCTTEVVHPGPRAGVRTALQVKALGLRKVQTQQRVCQTELRLPWLYLLCGLESTAPLCKRMIKVTTTH